MFNHASFTNASDLTERAVFLILTIQSLGNSRKVSTSEIEVEADKSLIRVSKTLLASKEIEAIGTFDNATRRWIESRCLPFEQRGVHLLPNTLIEETDAYLTERHRMREDLVTKLLDAYPALKERARRDLRELYNESDYPTVAQVREAYQMRWKYILFSTPAKLKQISAEIYNREREKAVQQWAEASALADRFLHQGLSELVNHMTERLTGSKDGKPKVFKSSTLANLREFLSTFKDRNINDNDQLQALVDRAKNLIEGVDVEDLRKREGTRDFVRDGFEKIKAKLDTMMVDRPRRMISFEDEDAPTVSPEPDHQPAA